jgi:hypothetical protein
MQQLSLTTILAPHAVLVQLTMAVVVQLAIAREAQAEYLNKTFSATFDDGTVMTGTFAGDAGDDEILESTLDLSYLSGDELDFFTIQIFVPNDQFGPTFRSYEYRRPWSDFSYLEYLHIYYDPATSQLQIRAENFQSIDGYSFLNTGPEGPVYFNAHGAYGWRLSEATVMIADVDTGFTFDWIDTHISLGLDAGLFDNEGTARSLSNMLHGAGAALDRGNTDAVLKILDAFVHRVEIQSGTQINPVMAEVLMYDALELISLLNE